MMPNVAPARTEAHPLRHKPRIKNHWKTFVHARLGVAMGDPGGVSLFGTRPERNRGCRNGDWLRLRCLSPFSLEVGG